MSDTVKALLDRVADLPDGNAWPSTVELLCDLRDCIEAQAAEIVRLRGANKAAAECVVAMMQECARYRDEIRAALDNKP